MGTIEAAHLLGVDQIMLHCYPKFMMNLEILCNANTNKTFNFNVTKFVNHIHIPNIIRKDKQSAISYFGKRT
jgi:hypothetical protein